MCASAPRSSAPANPSSPRQSKRPARMPTTPVWPELPYASWRDTAATLQLWTQIVGKVRLVFTPWLNHGWQVPLYVTARGLGTSPIPIGSDVLEIELDF